MKFNLITTHHPRSQSPATVNLAFLLQAKIITRTTKNFARWHTYVRKILRMAFREIFILRQPLFVFAMRPVLYIFRAVCMMLVYTDQNVLLIKEDESSLPIYTIV